MLAEQHAQQKQLRLHTEQELRDKLLKQKQAAAAAIATVDMQKKGAEAEAVPLRQEVAKLSGQVDIQSTALPICILVFSCEIHVVAPVADVAREVFCPGS